MSQNRWPRKTKSRQRWCWDSQSVIDTCMTRMLSPVCVARCSRTCLEGFRVQLNVDLSASSCLVLIVVLGPRRLPLHVVSTCPKYSNSDDVVVVVVVAIVVIAPVMSSQISVVTSRRHLRHVWRHRVSFVVECRIAVKTYLPGGAKTTSVYDAASNLFYLNFMQNTALCRLTIK